MRRSVGVWDVMVGRGGGVVQDGPWVLDVRVAGGGKYLMSSLRSKSSSRVFQTKKGLLTLYMPTMRPVQLNAG